MKGLERLVNRMQLPWRWGFGGEGWREGMVVYITSVISELMCKAVCNPETQSFENKSVEIHTENLILTLCSSNFCIKQNEKHTGKSSALEII